MKQIDDNSIDMILCDLPYGTTACSWDTIIPLDKLWIQYKRIIKDNGAIVLTSSQPFTSVLICSNLEMFKYNWIWKKDNGTNFITSHYQPLRITEEVCVFGKLGCSWNKKGNIQYYPQFEQGKPYACKSGKQKGASIIRGGTGGWDTMHGFETISDGKRYPKNLLEFNRDKEKVHPTQKPIALFEYLIKTYTKEGMLVLDNTIGSGTTAISCLRTNRNFIGIELSEEYIKIANERIQKELSQTKLNSKEAVSIPPKPKDLGILPTII